jgi:hypothetical protein
MDRKAGVGTNKPFSSSYYFAHNNPNTTGGYKDGLSMEDYTMNAPRLLSKGGKPVVEETVNPEATTAVTSMPISSPVTTNTTEQQQQEQPQPTRRRSLPITQYLWDDDGGATGAIIIEQLPGGLRSTDKPKTWSEIRHYVDVDDIQVTLYNDNRALQVTIPTNITAKSSIEGIDWDYHLNISPLFATATEVQVISKPKRLRIKITKKPTSKIWSSYERWPHAHKKKT